MFGTDLDSELRDVQRQIKDTKELIEEYSDDLKRYKQIFLNKEDQREYWMEHINTTKFQLEEEKRILKSWQADEEKLIRKIKDEQKSKKSSGWSLW